MDEIIIKLTQPMKLFDVDDGRPIHETISEIYVYDNDNMGEALAGYIADEYKHSSKSVEYYEELRAQDFLNTFKAEICQEDYEKIEKAAKQIELGNELEERCE